MACDRVCREMRKIAAKDLEDAAYELFEAANTIWGHKKTVSKLRGIQDRVYQIAGRIGEEAKTL